MFDFASGKSENPCVWKRRKSVLDADFMIQSVCLVLVATRYLFLICNFLGYSVGAAVL